MTSPWLHGPSGCLVAPVHNGCLLPKANIEIPLFFHFLNYPPYVYKPSISCNPAALGKYKNINDCTVRNTSPDFSSVRTDQHLNHTGRRHPNIARSSFGLKKRESNNTHKSTGSTFFSPSKSVHRFSFFFRVANKSVYFFLKRGNAVYVALRSIYARTQVLIK